MTTPPLPPSHAAAPLDALRSEVHAAISGDPAAARQALDAVGGLAVNLLVAILIAIFTLWFSGWLARAMRRALERIQAPRAPDATLQGFLTSITRWVVLIVGAIAVLQELGVQTTSILALLGAGSLAIGLAMQGSLSNVAAGVMLLVLRPYRVGDVVEINGRTGTVRRLDLFMTELTDADNLAIFMPNGKVFGEMIVNFSTPRQRRLELSFSIDYDDDLDLALSLLKDCARADPRVLAEPAPWSGVTTLEASAVTVALRCWTTTEDYWETRYAMVKRVKETLEAHGLSFPYPHQVAVERPKPALSEPLEPERSPDASIQVGFMAEARCFGPWSSTPDARKI